MNTSLGYTEENPFDQSFHEIVEPPADQLINNGSSNGSTSSMEHSFGAPMNLNGDYMSPQGNTIPPPPPSSVNLPSPNPLSVNLPSANPLPITSPSSNLPPVNPHALNPSAMNLHRNHPSMPIQFLPLTSNQISQMNLVNLSNQSNDQSNTRERHLKRNREAAQKCRQKKKQEKLELEKTLQELTDKNTLMVDLLRNIRNQLTDITEETRVAVLMSIIQDINNCLE